MERARRGKGKQKLLGSHQRCWLWGRNLVQATLDAGCWPILELHLADDLPAEQLASAQAVARAAKVSVQIDSRTRLETLVHTTEHQGYLAKMGPFPYVDTDELLARDSGSPLYLVLDGIQDPYNFGAMLRSADVFAADGVFIGQQRQVPVTSMVARSSVGVVNRLPIAQVESLATLADSLRERGVTVIGASEKGDVTLTDCNFRQPTAIIIGNEGAGLSPELIARCDRLARIPMSGQAGSLNAAAAAAVFFYEVQRQRTAPST